MNGRHAEEAEMAEGSVWKVKRGDVAAATSLLNVTSEPSQKHYYVKDFSKQSVYSSTDLHTRHVYTTVHQVNIMFVVWALLSSPVHERVIKFSNSLSDDF